MVILIRQTFFHWGIAKMCKNGIKLESYFFATQIATTIFSVANIDMANDKTTIRFWLRTDRLNIDRTAPIHLIYQIKGQRKYYAIPNIKLLPINWNHKEQVAIYIDKKKIKKNDPHINLELLLSGSDVEDINNKLASEITDVRNAEKRFKLDQVTFSASMVVDAIKKMKQPETKKDLPGTFIVDFIHRFIKETPDHKQGTLKEYKSLANHLSDYERLKKTKFTFEGDAAILNGFSVFLTEVKEVNNTTKAKLIGTFKTILRHAKKVPYKIKSNPDYLDFTVKRNDSQLEVIALTEEELESIISLDLTKSKTLDEARDIFCFSCATGFRYGDLKRFNRQHIRKDNTIVIPMSDKNDKKIEVPLNPISNSIIQKYSKRQFPLPVTTKKQELISCQKLNPHIKKIGKLAGIDTEIEKVRQYGKKKISLGIFKKHELLSIHVGRKTFTTLSLAKGMPIQDVMSITTHSSFAAVKRYIDVTKERKKSVMAEAWGSVNPLKVAK
ncbi:MAG TPA: tyrosine-type recombinase/integrase [Chitinophagaceae bacterium]|nr:tyrosine-type recombinase/integrase [Chitinophagaceae bacterium]